MHVLEPAVRPPSDRPHDDDSRLYTRILAEFREMPGLTLTLPQAARLFSVEPNRCKRVLADLVDARHLVTDGRTYARMRAVP
jgi:hypothetical protein